MLESLQHNFPWKSYELFGLKWTILCTILKDEINHTVDDLQNIANLVSSGFQRATKSVEIATPTYYANLVATSAKKWDMSDANGSTVFTTNSGAPAPVKRQNEFYYFRIGLMR
ncbi:hypothetical protein BY996DRAFT_6412017 [Phakopsora pachyrhizi]|nr:hypothetical protein BY996DRAFT_6412017 [Phakopsora pachyrhizi]